MKRPFVLALVFATALPGAALLVPVAAQAQAQPVFLVNSVLDQIDDDINDGVCHTAANTCPLRAAIMQANRITALFVMANDHPRRPIGLVHIHDLSEVIQG